MMAVRLLAFTYSFVTNLHRCALPHQGSNLRSVGGRLIHWAMRNEAQEDVLQKQLGEARFQMNIVFVTLQHYTGPVGRQ